MCELRKKVRKLGRGEEKRKCKRKVKIVKKMRDDKDHLSCLRLDIASSI